METLHIDKEFLLTTLKELLAIPSPSGYTDHVVHYTAEILHKLDIPYELTRRGAIRADIYGDVKSPDRAIVGHLDTLGAMVKSLKDNGRLGVIPIGFWSSRFAESCRVTIFSENEKRRGTILPLKASGHTFNEEIDKQPVNWETVEIRVDEKLQSMREILEAGIRVGDFVAIDPNSEFMENGYIVSRHLDNKAGVACILAAAEAIKRQKVPIPVNCHLLFTIFEEVGSGASAVLHGDVAEMVSVDNATPAPGQNSIEDGVTICIMDSSGPFDYHLTRKLVQLCTKGNIRFSRDIFKYYRTDAASAIEAGNDIRTALVCFGADASHGYERTHTDSLLGLSRLLGMYMQSEPTVKRDKFNLGPITGFPTQPLHEHEK